MQPDEADAENLSEGEGGGANLAALSEAWGVDCREFPTREYRVYLMGGAAAQGGSTADSLVVYTPAELDRDQGGGIAVDALQLPPGYFHWQKVMAPGAGGPSASPSVYHSAFPSAPVNE